MGYAGSLKVVLRRWSFIDNEIRLHEAQPSESATNFDHYDDEYR